MNSADFGGCSPVMCGIPYESKKKVVPGHVTKKGLGEFISFKSLNIHPSVHRNLLLPF